MKHSNWSAYWRNTATGLLALALLAGGCSSALDPAKIKQGMSRSQVIAVAGQPDDKERSVKNTEYIFGPVEAFWDRLEMGESYETWTYKQKGGSTFVYFLRDEDNVTCAAYVQDGTVY